MIYNTIWFILIAVLYIGYFVLEGFDMGVGILLPFLGKSDTQRRMIINTVGPHWDANEVWLITAGGATFAAFPNWYATLFSGFYLPLFFILIALIFRGVAFEFRSKEEGKTWRAAWDWAIFFGSLIPALLWGVAFANFIKGLPIDAHMEYVGGFWNLLSPYALLGGLVSLSGFTLAGAVYLALKTDEPVLSNARSMSRKLWPATAFLLVAFIFVTYVFTDIVKTAATSPSIFPAVAIVAMVVAGWLIFQKREGWAFVMLVIATAFSTASIFLVLFPRVMISSLDPKFSLTITNAASSQGTLQTMTIVAAICIPIVLVYQAYTYWVFRKRVTQSPKDLHY
jgi:cytochrome bd ubiquinol oxidase subunit II